MCFTSIEQENCPNIYEKRFELMYENKPANLTVHMIYMYILFVTCGVLVTDQKTKKKKRHLDSFCRRCISGFNFQLITKKENMQTPGIFPQHSKVFKHHNMEKKKLKTKIRTSSQNEQLHVAVILKLASSSMNNPVCINPIQKT